MQLTMSSSPSRFASFKRQLTGLLVFVLIVSWTSILTYTTVSIQHSCQPLLYWTEVTSANCISPTKTKLTDKKLVKNELKAPTKVSQQKVSDKLDRSGAIGNISESSDKPSANSKKSEDDAGTKKPSNLEKVAVAVGVATTVGLAVIGAPVILTAMAGTSAVLATCHWLLKR